VFPNPQDALPLPTRPSLEQYRKLAKDLVKACRSGTPHAIGAWTDRWIAALLADSDQRRRDRAASQVEEFTIRVMTGGKRACLLADAQFVIARSHGFESWPKFSAHLDALAHSGAPFEAAAQAIVAGDEETLRRVLRERPELIRARSEREHRATLLHYVSANGVENYRQQTPQNIVRIAEVLLAAGAVVDAEANVYGGGSTTLGLVATSAHPRQAGVQIALIELLLDQGARMEHPNLAGNAHGAVFACLANGCPEAARYLADRGARLDLVAAAGVGRLDVVQSLVDQAAVAACEMALRYAAAYGNAHVVRFLLDRGLNVDAHTGDGETALFYTVLRGHLDVINLLLERGARPGVRTRYGGDVVGAALWRAGHGGDPDLYVSIIETLVAAGGQLPARHPPVNETVDAAVARHGSVADPAQYWWGEEPRAR
jgi:ankyrin repeat protein